MQAPRQVRRDSWSWSWCGAISRIAGLGLLALFIVALILVPVLVLLHHNPKTVVSADYFDESGVELGGTLVKPGAVAVYSAPLDAKAAVPIRLLGLSLISVPGFPLPRLVHLALLGRSLAYPAGTTGWPPLASFGKTYPIRPFAGIIVKPAQPKSGGLPPIVLYAVTGNRPNTMYAVAGVIIRYEVGGETRVSSVFSGAMACVVQFSDIASMEERQWCARQYHLVEKNQAGMSSVKKEISQEARG
jgi:hypothetical protein